MASITVDALTESFKAYDCDYYSMKIRVSFDQNGKSIEVEIYDCRVDIFEHELIKYAKYLQWKFGPTPTI